MCSCPAPTAPRTLLQDAYAEHFTAVPADIAFSRDGSGTFAVAPESKNEVRNITFNMWPGGEWEFGQHTLNSHERGEGVDVGEQGGGPAPLSAR